MIELARLSDWLTASGTAGDPEACFSILIRVGLGVDDLLSLRPRMRPCTSPGSVITQQDSQAGDRQLTGGLTQVSRPAPLIGRQARRVGCMPADTGRGQNYRPPEAGGQEGIPAGDRPASPSRCV